MDEISHEEVLAFYAALLSVLGKNALGNFPYVNYRNEYWANDPRVTQYYLNVRNSYGIAILPESHPLNRIHFRRWAILEGKFTPEELREVSGGL